MSDSSAQVLFLRLEDYEQPEFFDDLYRGICSQISAKYTTMVVKDAPDVQGLLSSPSLKVILIVDSTLSQGKFTALQKQLARFVKAGGVLVVCCFFSNSVCPPNAHKMWKNFDLPWTYGDYHRTTFYLSQKAKVFFGNQRAGTLERQCSMKTLHLKGSTVDSRVYVPLEQSRTQSMVFARDTVDQNLSPAAWAKSGNGSLGYIGDVNNEAGTHKLLMVMLETARNTEFDAATHGGPYTSTSPGCHACGSWTPVKRCKRCEAQYCSVDCQKAHWYLHRDYCRMGAGLLD